MYYKESLARLVHPWLEVASLTYGSHMSKAWYCVWLDHLLAISQTRSANVYICIFINIFFRPRISVWGTDCYRSAPRVAMGAMGTRHVCPESRVFGVFLLTLFLRFTGAIVLGVILVLSETRSSIILARIAKDIRKTTGDSRYRTSAEIDKPDMLSLIKTSCTRPLCTHDLFFSGLSSPFS